jgi:phosphate transport system permease protein
LSQVPPLREAAGATSPGASLSLKARPRPKERAIRALLAACGLLSILTTAGIVFTLGFEAVEFFREVSPVEFFTTTTWSPLIKPFQYGVLPLIAGTLKIVLVSTAVGVPLGVGTAIYLSEYASPRLRNTLKPILEVLAGIPTIVLAYFALTFVTPHIVRALFPGAGIYNALSAGLVVGVMIVPIIASLSEDAMSAVPRALREGAYGLGASKMVVSVRVVFPAALSGIMASIILGISRAVGETMVVALAAGSCPKWDANLLDCTQTLTGYIVQAAFGDVGRGGAVFTSIFAVGAVLFVMTLVLNIVSIGLVRRFRQAY